MGIATRKARWTEGVEDESAVDRRAYMDNKPELTYAWNRTNSEESVRVESSYACMTRLRGGGSLVYTLS